MDFQKIVKGLGRGWYITNTAIIGARMHRGICNRKTHLYKKKLILKMRKKKFSFHVALPLNKKLVFKGELL